MDLSGCIDDVLKSVKRSRILVEDLTTVSKSMGWRLGGQHWATAGTSAFSGGQVPYTITNDGHLSARAAALLLHHCRLYEPTGLIKVIELGAGTGLFAKFFLDEFKTLCGKSDQTYYDRLAYVVTDFSATSVEDWQRHDVFHDHPDVVLFEQCDATDTNSLQRVFDLRGRPPTTVIANYILDVLPIHILRRSGAGFEELHVQTFVNEHRRRKHNFEFAKIEAPASTFINEASVLEDYEPLLPFLECSTAFVPCLPPSQNIAALLAQQPDLTPVTINTGALDLLDVVSQHMQDNGFVLVNDYGQSRDSDEHHKPSVDNFGATIASGLNFPAMQTLLNDGSRCFVAPCNVEELPIQSRMLILQENEMLAEQFSSLFDGKVYQEQIGPLNAARYLVEAERLDEALDSYDKAVKAFPYDWRLLGEVSEFLRHYELDLEAAHTVAQEAIRLDPWYNSWLWCVLGDAQFALGDHSVSHESFLKAKAINADDPRADYSLSYTHTHFGRYPEALYAIARGLNSDSDGVYRDRLLEHQTYVLSMQDRWRQELKNSAILRSISSDMTVNDAMNGSNT